MMKRWVIGVAILGAGTALTAGAAPQVEYVTVGIQPVSIVYKPAAIHGFVEASAQRRVDIAGLGDSNQFFAGTYGHDHGIQKAWADVRGMYATGVLPFAANNLSSWPAAGVQYSASPFGGHGFSSTAPTRTRAVHLAGLQRV